MKNAKLKDTSGKNSFPKAMLLMFSAHFFFIQHPCSAQKKVKSTCTHVIYDKMASPSDYPKEIHHDIMIQRDILYGEAAGYYTSKSMERKEDEEASSILKEAMEILARIGQKPNIFPLYMDIYYPNNSDVSPKPLLLFVHGGGFFFGDKDNKLQRELTYNLIGNDFVIASVNYRLGSKLWGFEHIKKAIYRCVQDVRSALRYVTYYADELNIDPDRIYLAGSSSGGIIALTTAFMDEDEIFSCCNKERFIKKFGKLNDSGNSIDCRYRLAGVISLWGGITDLNMIENRNQVPTLLFHGTEDKILYNDTGIPFYDYLNSYMKKVFFKSEALYGSLAIYRYMKSQGMPVKYISFDGYDHAPHTEKDGSFNQNIEVVKQEINKFMKGPEAGCISNINRADRP